MKKIICFGAALAAVFLVARPCFSSAGASKLHDAIAVLQEIEAIPESGIPPALFRHAHAIAVIPGMIKAGFIVGARYGTGVLAARRGGRWSDPVFVELEGGSVGFQIGAESTDIILVFETARSLGVFRRGKFTFGADVSAAAGPVGRNAQAATDLELKAEIYSYSRSRGFFGGVAIQGAALSVDDAANTAFYGRPASADQILDGMVRAPGAAAGFRRMLGRLTLLYGHRRR